tara:strand:- start:77 stop:301 length:225 start_codon:yes stop_codon:yes gene_type:complete
MRLDEYIKKNHKSIREFSAKVGLKHRNVEMWGRGERLPRPFDAKKIIEATNGVVDGSDFYSARIEYLEKEMKIR